MYVCAACLDVISVHWLKASSPEGFRLAHPPTPCGRGKRPTETVGVVSPSLVRVWSSGLSPGGEACFAHAGILQPTVAVQVRPVMKVMAFAKHS